MNTQELLVNLKTAHDNYAVARREIIDRSSAAQHAAKRAIFAVTRGDLAAAKRLLAEAEQGIAAARESARVNPRLVHEGSLRAALEEYAEAVLFAGLAETGEVKPIDGLDEETLIGGLCDAVGELVRLMTVRATEGKDDEVRRLKAAADEVVRGLTEMDFSGYLRTKYDQAKSHLRKAEEILYDLAMRGR